MVNSYQFRHGFSKSQSCLHKILQIIASYPSQEHQSSSLSIPQITVEFEEKKQPSIDLNSQLFPWLKEDDEEDSECFSASSTTAATATAAAASKSDFVRRDFAAEKSSSEGECEKGSEKSEELNEVKGFPHGGFEAAAAAEAAAEEEKRKTDCFSILIEAAETVSGDFKDKEEKCFRQSEAVDDGEEPPVTAVSAVEEVLPVVRSKRGRSHVLPSRYRDSVIEPVKRRQPRSVVPTKRGKFSK